MSAQQFPTMPPRAVYVVYDGTSAHPGKLVVILWNPTPVGMPIAVADSLEEARRAIQARHPAAVRHEPTKHEDPAILEMWL